VLILILIIAVVISCIILTVVSIWRLMSMKGKTKPGKARGLTMEGQDQPINAVQRAAPIPQLAPTPQLMSNPPLVQSTPADERQVSRQLSYAPQIQMVPMQMIQQPGQVQQQVQMVPMPQAVYAQPQMTYAAPAQTYQMQNQAAYPQQDLYAAQQMQNQAFGSPGAAPLSFAQVESARSRQMANDSYLYQGGQSRNEGGLESFAKMLS